MKKKYYKHAGKHTINNKKITYTTSPYATASLATTYQLNYIYIYIYKC